MKLAIIGSRGFGDYELLTTHLKPYIDTTTLVVSGGAKGADKLGERWAIQNNIPTLIFNAEWDRYGRRAGFVRNEDIIKNCDFCIAFWDGESKGTSHSISLCKKHNKQTIIIQI